MNISHDIGTQTLATINQKDKTQEIKSAHKVEYIKILIN
ncbi:hypothetical protein CPS_3063 [Colwellia psychrerythraea 34H]|uniref:Uncharacterized protein n=1 Tax=Colwellia psychrerythraea (strain 34H / ATCC BAA-681) TaxID=167879 RepID=Q47ZK9_COLP3|nr:hypothetical protein CPS_3063 [Colwellia psychrerythraea 34H]